MARRSHQSVRRKQFKARRRVRNAYFDEEDFDAIAGGCPDPPKSDAPQG